LSVERKATNRVLKWMPLLWSNVWRRKTRTTLTMISVLATFIIFGLLDSFRNAVAIYGDDYANSLVVQSRNVRLPHSHVERLLAMSGVTTACGVLMAPARLPSEKRTFIQAVDDPGIFEAHPGLKVSATAIDTWHQDRTAVLISADVARENGWRVGDRLMLPGLPRGPAYQRPDGRNALEIVVAGVFSAQNTVAAQGIFAHFEYVRDLVGADRARLEYIAVRLAPGQDVDVMRSRIDAEFANSPAPVKAYSSRALLRAYHGTYRELADLSVTVLVISFATLLLIAGSVLMQAQRERARESAVLEAIGWSKARLAALLALESTVLILPPAVMGLVVAGFAAPKIDAGISPRILFEALLLAAIFVLSVSVVPIMRSSTAQIAPRLAGE
jgi:putative ABC transport system permease protein